MTRVEFEPTIAAGERPCTYALYRAATGTGISMILGQQLENWPTKLHLQVLHFEQHNCDVV